VAFALGVEVLLTEPSGQHSGERGERLNGDRDLDHPGVRLTAAN
jgi:hypothetical protein